MYTIDYILKIQPCKEEQRHLSISVTSKRQDASMTDAIFHSSLISNRKEVAIHSRLRSSLFAASKTFSFLLLTCHFFFYNLVGARFLHQRVQAAAKVTRIHQRVSSDARQTTRTSGTYRSYALSNACESRKKTNWIIIIFWLNPICLPGLDKL